MNLDTLLTTIKSRRKAMHLSQTDIAEKLFISLKAYQNIESGQTRMDLGRLDQLAMVLDTDVQALLYADKDFNFANQMQSNEEKELYLQIIKEKENYIAFLEESLHFYRSLLKENFSI